MNNDKGAFKVIYLHTNIESKRMTFDEAENYLKDFGCHIGGNWDYDRGMFDGILYRKDGKTIYLRMPFQVIEGELDNRNALIEFQKPFIIKHVVNLGIAKDSSALLSATGFAQFQKPLDKDGHIPNQSNWQEFGEDIVGEIMDELRRKHD